MLPLLLGALAGCERGVELDPPRSSASTPQASGGEQRGTATLVTRLQDGLRDRDADALEALATPAARPLLASVAENARALDVRDVALRYLAPDAPPSEAERAELGDDVQAVRVQLEYRYAGVDRRPARLESRLLVSPGPDGPLLAGLGGTSSVRTADAEDGRGTRTPLWLGTALTVVRRGPALLAVAGTDAGRYPRLVTTAVRQVREVLPQWDGPLVVEVPADRAQLDAALAAPEGRYDAIAGVATTVDGSVTRGSPTRVYLNPAVFDGLSRQGAQVVLTHEATHLAVGAPYADMPLWLLEGFADYVALAGDRVPVGVAARQVLRRVREDGPPDGLPTAADLDPSAPGLGATYEEAWLACRFLAQQDGQQALVRFYESVDDGTPAQQAFQQVLGTSEAAFVAAWRRDVAELARVRG